jgi:hypothetical protein
MGGADMPEKKFNKVCQCENCGNEAEMVFTCTIEETDDQSVTKPQATESQQKHQMMGHGVCSHCGNEADMWIDIDA